MIFDFESSLSIDPISPSPITISLVLFTVYNHSQYLTFDNLFT